MTMLLMFPDGATSGGGGPVVTPPRGKQARGRNRARLWWLVISAGLLTLTASCAGV